MTAINIESILNITGGSLVGTAPKSITGAQGIEDAGPQDISFISNPKYFSKLNTTRAGLVILNSNIPEDAIPGKGAYIRCADPYLAFCKVLTAYFAPQHNEKGIHKTAIIESEYPIPSNVLIGAYAYIGPGVKLGDGVKIYSHVHVGSESQIGDHTVLYPHVTLYHHTIIGAHCIIHSGTVIGSDGFGHAPMPDGSYAKIPQIGNVIIGNHVEIGSNCSIDRGTLGSTQIEDGVKLDNLIQVAHNVKIGAHTVMASQSGISGSTSLGKYCMVGGQVGFAGHIQIADGSRFGAQSGVPSTIKDKSQTWMGTPIMPLKDNMRAMVIGKRLPELLKRIQDLEQKLKDISQ